MKNVSWIFAALLVAHGLTGFHCLAEASPSQIEDSQSKDSQSEDTVAVEEDQKDPEVFESEIMVTARKRAENIQEIPIAITAFSDTALEARSMRDLTNIADFTPNLNFSISGGAGGSPSEATVYLRGVGQIETGIMADPGVGIYVDGVFIARSQGAVFDLLDLDRVEVLRGPQGTLFGKNTTGGAIQLVTRKPSRDFDFSATGTIGNLGRHDLTVRVGGGFSDKVFGSIAALSSNRDGFATSLINGGTFNNDNRDSLRGALRFLPTDSLTVDLSLDLARERETALDQKLIAVIGSPILDFMNNLRAIHGQSIVDETFFTNDLHQSFSDGPSINNGDVTLATLRIAHAAQNWHLLSITAYRDYEYVGASDFDGTPLRYFERSYVQTQNQFSQELQFSGTAADDRVKWVAGALYFEENPVDDSSTFAFANTFELLEAAPGPIHPFPVLDPAVCSPGPPPPGVLCLGGAGNPLNFLFFNGGGMIDVLDVDTVSYAAFGEATWILVNAGA